MQIASQIDMFWIKIVLNFSLGSYASQMPQDYEYGKIGVNIATQIEIVWNKQS